MKGRYDDHYKVNKTQDELMAEAAELNGDAIGTNALILLPSGDTQCPVCGLLNPDVPGGTGRCEVCTQFVREVTQ